MKKNVGGMDRRGRLLLGPVLLAMGLKKRGRLGLVLSGAGAVLLVTGATGYCPANGVLGVDTAK